MDFFRAIHRHVLEEKAFKMKSIEIYVTTNVEDTSIVKFFRVFITLLDMFSHESVCEVIDALEEIYNTSIYSMVLIFLSVLKQRIGTWNEFLLNDEGSDVPRSVLFLTKLVAWSSLRYWEYEREGAVVRKYDAHYVVHYLNEMAPLALLSDHDLFELFSIHTMLIEDDLAAHPHHHFTLHVPRTPHATPSAQYYVRSLWFQFYLPLIQLNDRRFAANKTMRTKMRRSMRNVERVGVGRLLA